jgi:hypothetical protein
MRLAIQFLLTLPFWLCLIFPSLAISQSPSRIDHVSPRVIPPGKTSKVIVFGKSLKDGIQCIAQPSSIDVQCDDIRDDRVTATISVPSSTSLGPLSLLLKTSDGVISTQPMVIDDLPLVTDHQDNHARDSAISIASRCVIEGTSAGTLGRFYRLQAKANERIAFQVLTQILHSKMDPLLQISDSRGCVLMTSDDDELGPECRTSYVFPEDADYFLEVRDNKFATGDAFLLRIGDFPEPGYSLPLAVHKLSPSTLRWNGQDADQVDSIRWIPTDDVNATSLISWKRRNGRDFIWAPVLLQNAPQFVESIGAVSTSDNATERPYLVPFGISGKLDVATQSDRYWTRAQKGQKVRFQSRTRSLGCPTLLSMELRNRDSKKVAGTVVSDMDEWSFDFEWPDDEPYQLVVNDLLRRGGQSFGYWIGVDAIEPLQIGLKPSASTKQRFIIEPKQGLAVVDLTLQRNKASDLIRLSLSDSSSNLQLLNPIIPANVKEWKLLIACTESWNATSFQALHLEAAINSNATSTSSVSIESQRRLNEPHVLFPVNPHEKPFAFAGAPETPAVFSVECDEPVSALRSSQELVLPVIVKIHQNDFKGNISWLGLDLPPGWSLTATREKDAYQVKLKRPSDSRDFISNVSLVAFADHKGRTKHQLMTVPIVWTDSVADGPKVLSVYPPTVELVGSRSRQQLLISGDAEDHTSRDWTTQAVFFVSDPSIAEVKEGVVYPKSEGTTRVTVFVGEAKTSFPLSVSKAKESPKVGFESEVLVALSKQGCNSGACHGSPSGKGGFRLSLRAFDAKLDEETLIHEEFGRRIDCLSPEASLLLTKPTMQVAHGGGKQLHTSDPAYSILREWIAQGAPTDDDDAPRCVRLEVKPDRRSILPLHPDGQQLAVTAHFSNGDKRDVTHLVAYESSNVAIATVDRRGKVIPQQRGEVAILVRFLEHIEALPLMFMQPDPKFEWNTPVATHLVDIHVHAKLKQLQMHPSPIASNSDFLRRAFLDLIGVLPELSETKAFLADKSPDKRAVLIDQLLSRDEYSKFWALKWGDLLRITSKSLGEDSVFKFHRWIESSLKSNMPYDQFARDLLLSSGSTFANPPVQFYRSAKDANECVETIAQVFLGSRLQCAKCHNHPFERWTQDNYYGLAGFFHSLERRKTQRAGEWFLWISDKGPLIQPRTGKPVSPWLPDASAANDSKPLDPREPFVNWLIHPENRFFARVEVNRVWSQFFKRGIVDPVDDFRDSNPPSIDSLLDALTADFIQHGFDRKHLIRTIMTSNTYQASVSPTATNENDGQYFSHHIPRLLHSEQLLDAVSRSLGVSTTFKNLPASTLATQLPAPDLVSVEFLKSFGQPERNTVCACERSDEPTMGMAIELLNGALVQEKLKAPNNRFRQAVASSVPLESIIRDMYLASVCRLPSDAELRTAVEHCQSRHDAALGLEDFVWALLNTEEFLFQH